MFVFSFLIFQHNFYNYSYLPAKQPAGASYLTLENLNNSNIVAAKKSSYYSLTPASSTTSLNDLNNSKNLLEDFSSANTTHLINRKKTHKTKQTLSTQHSLSSINIEEHRQGKFSNLIIFLVADLFCIAAKRKFWCNTISIEKWIDSDQRHFSKTSNTTDQKLNSTD